MDANLEYNLGQLREQLDRCERGFQELQGVIQRYLQDLAMLRQQYQAVAQQVGVEAVPVEEKAAELPPAVVEEPPTPKPTTVSPATVTTAPKPETPPVSPSTRGRGGGSGSRGRSSGRDG